MDESDYKLIFGKVIAKLRNEHGWGQSQFAAEIGVSQPTLSRIERGKVLPDVFTFKLMADALDRSVGELDQFIDHTFERVMSAANGATGDSGNDGLAAVFGAAALGGLIGFAIATLINEK